MRLRGASRNRWPLRQQRAVASTHVAEARDGWTPTGWQQAILAGNVSVKTRTTTALRVLDKVRAQIIADLGANPREWQARFQATLLARVNERIDELRTALGKLPEEISSDVQQQVQRLLGALAPLGEIPLVGIDPSTVAGLAMYRAELITRLTTAARERVADIIRHGLSTGLTLGQVEERLGSAIHDRGVFGSLGVRLRTIIRTEYKRELGFGLQAMYNDVGSVVPGLMKEWVAQVSHATPPRPEHAAAHGQRVPYNQPFIVGGEELMFPGDPRGSPELVINCRCESVPVLPDVAEPEPEAEPEPVPASPGEPLSPASSWLRTVERLEGELAQTVAELEAEAQRLNDELDVLNAEHTELDRQYRERRDKQWKAYTQTQGWPNPDWGEHPDEYVAWFETVFNNSPAETAERERRQQLREKMDALHKRIASVYLDVNSARDQMETRVAAEWEQLRRRLRPDGEVGPVVYMSGMQRPPIGSPDAAQADAAAIWMSAHLPVGIQDMWQVEVQFYQGRTGRPHARGDTIHIFDGHRASTYCHEMGHVAERRTPNQVKRSAMEVMNRARGTLVERLADVEPGRGYEQHEITLKDAWPDAYTGRIYTQDSQHQWIVDWRDAKPKDYARLADGLRATEVVSMGYQEWYESGHLRFRHRDPRHYEFMVRLALEDW